MSRSHRIYDGVTDAIGGTPLIRLSRFLPDNRIRLFAKMEALNPGGSAKDRPALRMIRQAISEGVVREGGTIIESSSGNMAIGLAQACICFGLRLICVVDPKTPSHTIEILRAYGVQTVLVSEPDAETGEFQPARIARVRQLLDEIAGAFWPNQYANMENARAHYATMREIEEALDGKIDYLICPVSTCGTIRGCVDYCARAGINATIVAVDAKGSTIFGGKREKRLLSGHGGTIRPGLVVGLRCDLVVYVSDADCVAACRHLVATEGILAGASSGGALMVAARMARNFPAGASCVIILHDCGERYLQNVYSDEWVCSHFGCLPNFQSLSLEDPDVRRQRGYTEGS